MKHIFVLTVLTSMIFSTVLGQYCEPIYTVGSEEGDFIDGVILESISNTESGESTSLVTGYSDYTDLTTILEYGLTYNLELTNNPNFAQTYTAWIDYNQNEIFELDEVLGNIVLDESAAGIIEFSLPLIALTGETRMRIRCIYQEIISFPLDPCGSETYGEVEDYTIIVPSDSDFDLGVTNITSLVSDCGLAEQELSVEFFNYGINEISVFDFSYQVEHPTLGILPVITESYAGPPIPSLTSGVFTFSENIDFTENGLYSIKAFSILESDDNSLNDSSDILINSIPTINTFPYNEGFEIGSNGWTSGGVNNSWELGSPDGDVINTPPPATPESENSWITSLSDPYNEDESSWLLSPCFDFSSLILPEISFDIWWETLDAIDGVRLEYTLDGGGSWLPIENVGTGENWYSGSCFSFGINPETSEYFSAWEGSSGAWLKATNDINFLAGEPLVQFRYHMHSGDLVTGQNGVAVDNINIADPSANDLALIDIISPFSDVGLSTEESVIITIKNLGSASQSGFDITYQLNDGDIISETFVDEIAPGDSVNFLFSEPVNVGLFDVYDLCVWVQLESDTDTGNDSLCIQFANLQFSNYYICSSTTGFQPWSSSSNIELMDTVFGVGWKQDYFETLSVEQVFSDSTCTVFLEGSEYHANELELFINENISTIEDWVFEGGKLFINSAPSEGDGMFLGFGGVELVFTSFSSSALAFNPAHPIFEGPYLPSSTAWTGESFSHARFQGVFDTLIVDDGSIDTVILAEKIWGDGIVMFGGMTMPNFHSPAEDAFNLRANVLAYLNNCNFIPVIDVGIDSIISPLNDCVTGEKTVSIIIENFTPSDVFDIAAFYMLDGIPSSEELIGDTIPPYSTLEYTFTELVDLPSIGSYLIETLVFKVGDVDISNNSIETIVEVYELPLIELPPDGQYCDELLLDAGNPGSEYLWSTGETTQTIIVNEADVYTVTVIDSESGCSNSDEIELDFNYSPIADFTFETIGLFVDFTNTSIDGLTGFWDFGDGNTATNNSPNHSYNIAGDYVVTLIVSNECGSDTISQVLSVINSIELLNESQIQIYPNPTSGVVSISFSDIQNNNLVLEVLDYTGRQLVYIDDVYSKYQPILINLSSFNEGIYTLIIYNGERYFSQQIVLSKN